MRCRRCKRWEVPCRSCRREMLGLPAASERPKVCGKYLDSLDQLVVVTMFGADWVQYRYADESRHHEMDRLEFMTSFREASP